MITDVVLTAAITAAAGILCQLIIARSTGNSVDAKLDKQQAITSTKLDELTREVRRHNNFAERIPVMEEQIRAANHRIADLERNKP